MRTMMATLLFSTLALDSAAVGAAGLPDTGMSKCYDGTTLVACTDANSGDAARFPRQDGRFGRDAKAAAGTLNKTGGGAAGFDYTKIANSGDALPAAAALGSAASDWACTRDNITGLTWEIKTDDGGLRDKDWTYTWFNSVAATNGGGAGTAGNTNTCKTAGRCDTEKFIADVNSGAGLCGHADWRLPSRHELFTLVNVSRSSPAIDTAWFPNTVVDSFWSDSTYIGTQNSAWSIASGSGGSGFSQKSVNLPVRLVRGGRL